MKQKQTERGMTRDQPKLQTESKLSKRAKQLAFAVLATAPLLLAGCATVKVAEPVKVEEKKLIALDKLFLDTIKKDHASINSRVDMADVIAAFAISIKQNNDGLMSSALGSNDLDTRVTAAFALTFVYLKTKDWFRLTSLLQSYDRLVSSVAANALLAASKAGYDISPIQQILERAMEKIASEDQ